MFSKIIFVVFLSSLLVSACGTPAGSAPETTIPPSPSVSAPTPEPATATLAPTAAAKATEVPFSPDLWKNAGTSKEVDPNLPLVGLDSIKTPEDFNNLPRVALADIISGKFANSYLDAYKQGKIKFPSPGKIRILYPELLIDVPKLNNGLLIYSAVRISGSDFEKGTYNDLNKKPDLVRNFYLIDFGGGEVYVMFPTLWDTGDKNNPDITINLRPIQEVKDYLSANGIDTLNLSLGTGASGMNLPAWFKSESACKYKMGPNFCSYWFANQDKFKTWYTTWANTNKIPNSLHYFPNRGIDVGSGF